MPFDRSDFMLDHDSERSTAYVEALRFLDSKIDFEKRRSFSVDDLGRRMERLRRFLVSCGSPEKRYRTIHVAGTKGKGSTCAMIEGILLEGGYRVGRFSSPHLYSVRERFLIDGVPCEAEDFARLTFAVRDRIAAVDPELLCETTFFELTTLVAFHLFAEQRVDVAVLEVGLGGRLDATNLCSPSVTVVTSISFDHMEQLGPTLEEIAAEKGGIIKPEIPLVSSVRRPEAQQVLRQIAKTAGAPAYFLGEAFSIYPASTKDVPGNRFRFRTSNRFPVQADFDALSTKLPGSHQCRNASLAIASALLLRQVGIEPDEQAIRNGLAKSFVPIRVEMIPLPDGSVFAVDGGHNRSSVRAFIKTVREAYPESRLYLIFGTSIGKDVEGMLSDLLPHFERVFLTQHSSHPRRFPPQGIKTIVSAIPEAPPGLQDEFRRPDDGVEIDFSMEDSIFLDHPGISFTPKTGWTCPEHEAVRRPFEVEVVEDCREALRRCRSLAEANDVVCVTGSMFLAAELREIFFRLLRSP